MEKIGKMLGAFLLALVMCMPVGVHVAGQNALGESASSTVVYGYVYDRAGLPVDANYNGLFV